MEHSYRLACHFCKTRKVVVICKNHKGVDEEKFEIHQFNNGRQALKLLNQYANHESIIYNDDHLAYLLWLSRRKYIITYHGNWPDLLFASASYFFKGLYFIPMYMAGLLGAKEVIHVSRYMLTKWRFLNHKSKLIYNATFKDSPEVESVTLPRETSMLCLGNVITRKYANLLEMLNRGNTDLLKIHIYGTIVDQALADKLKRFPNVQLHGYSNSIPWHEHDVLGCFSKSENLPLSIVEALHHNLPVITTDVGGIKEVINETNGLIFQSDVDLQQVATAISEKVFSFTDTEILAKFHQTYAFSKYDELFR